MWFECFNLSKCCSFKKYLHIHKLIHLCYYLWSSKTHGWDVVTCSENLYFCYGLSSVSALTKGWSHCFWFLSHLSLYWTFSTAIMPSIFSTMNFTLYWIIPSNLQICIASDMLKQNKIFHAPSTNYPSFLFFYPSKNM